MADIDTATIKNDITSLAESSLADHSGAAIQDGTGLFTQNQDLVQLYSDQLGRGEISQAILENDLREDLLGLANMDQLVNTGLEQARITTFTEGVIGILVRAAIAAAIAAI